MKTKKEKLIESLQAMNGPHLFRCESCDPKFDTQRNLAGRTHYADESTLRYFKARILNADCAQENLLFWHVESVNSRPDHGGYNKRFVVHDIWGQEVSGREEWFRTTAQAEKALREWLNGFDALEHSLAKVKGIAKRNKEQAEKVLAIA